MSCSKSVHDVLQEQQGSQLVGLDPGAGGRGVGGKAREVKREAAAVFQVRDAGFSLGVSCAVCPQGPLLTAPRLQRTFFLLQHLLFYLFTCLCSLRAGTEFILFT